jgi:arylsulfatase A-like enzyme
MYDSSLIIITSDHGELLGEHGIYEHRCQLYEGAVKVPLIIKFPYNKRIGRESKPINLTDVYATTLRICDLPIPDNISGEAFGGAFSQVSELYSDTLGEHKVIYDGNYKYMAYSNIKGASAKKSELYDLTRDPQEKENLIDVDTERAAAMHMKLESWKKHRKQGYEPAKTNAPVSEELREKLKSLGYVQ